MKQLTKFLLIVGLIFSFILPEQADAGGWLKKRWRRLEKDVSNGGRKLERALRPAFRTYGAVATLGYTRYLRKKGQAMAEEAYARAVREAWEEKKYMEVQRLIEKHGYVLEVINQQDSYMVDIKRAIVFQKMVLHSAKAELITRTATKELSIRISSLFKDQEEAADILINAIGENNIIITNTQSAVGALEQLRLAHNDVKSSEVSENLIEVGLAVNWDSAIQDLMVIAKSRNKMIGEYVLDLMKVTEKSELEQLIGIIENVKQTLESLLAKIEMDKANNDTYAKAIEHSLVNSYQVKIPTPEEQEAAALKRQEEEKKMIEEMLKEKQKAIDDATPEGQQRIAEDKARALERARAVEAARVEAQRKAAAAEVERRRRFQNRERPDVGNPFR